MACALASSSAMAWAFRLEGLVHDVLGHADGRRRCAGKTGGQLLGRQLQCGSVFDEVVDHAQSLGLVRSHGTCGEHQLLGFLQTHDAWQQLHGAQVWHQADATEDGAELERRVASTKSAARARLSPAPKAAPSTAAITGFSMFTSSENHWCKARMRSR